MKVEVDFSAIKEKINYALNNPYTRRAINNEFARMCNPYVPMKEGVLSQSVRVLDDGLYYPGPYAHYMYIGQIYGPNFPIIQDGMIVGWRSPKGKGSKHPTGRPIHYSTERHPLASKEWDKAMMRDKGEEFANTVGLLLMRSVHK